MIHHAVSFVGFMIFAGISWLLSSSRRKIAWRTIAWGVALQLLIGLIIFRLPGSHRFLLWLNDAVLVLLNASKSGSVFLFGPLAASPGESGSIGFILVFQVLPVVIFFAAFTSMFYHLRVLQIFVRLFARLASRRSRQPRLTSLAGCDSGNADDRVCGGDLQRRRRGVPLENRLSSRLLGGRSPRYEAGKFLKHPVIKMVGAWGFEP